MLHDLGTKEDRQPTSGPAKGLVITITIMMQAL